MKGKLLILAAGVGIGFLLGSRAGRGPYERFAARTKECWEDPRVQRQVDRSIAFVNDKCEGVVEIIATGTRNIVHRLTAPKQTPTRSPSGSSSRSTTAAKSGGASKPAKSSSKSSGTTSRSRSSSSSSAGKSAAKEEDAGG